MWTRLVILACALGCGCTTLSDSECRSADWYTLGERDGLIYGLRPQIDVYAHRCSKHGVQASEKDYMAGWVDGYREWTRRVSGSDCCGTR